MSLQELNVAKADAALCLQDLKSTPPDKFDVHGFLRDNLIPLLQSFMHASIEEHEEHAGAIMELIETHEDVIHPELAAIIIGTLESGKLICQILADNDVKLEDELANRRLQEGITAFKRHAVIAIERVAEATTILDEDLDDEEENDDVQSEPPESQEATTAPITETKTEAVAGESQDTSDPDPAFDDPDDADAALAEAGE